MRTLLCVLVMALSLAPTGCESDAKKKCNAECDKEAARADKCDGPGAAECKSAIGEIVDECRTACKEVTETTPAEPAAE